MNRTLATALVAVAAVATAATAYAAIPAGNGVISACKTKDGAIKLIDEEAGQSCPGSQHLVEWNQQGSTGPAGVAGADGEDGVSGRVVVFNTSGDFTSDHSRAVEAVCPTGTLPIGGGGRVLGTGPDAGPDNAGPTVVSLHTSYPTPSGWYVKAAETVPTEYEWLLRTYVICAATS